MATWAAQMDALNAKLLSVFPDAITFNGAEIACIAPPLQIFKMLNPSTYDGKVTFTFQILESDRATAGIGLRSVISFATPYGEAFNRDGHLLFEVYQFEPDKNDSMVRLICNLKQ
jgi:hypothetical protein